MTLDAITRVVEKLGLPVALLVVLGFALWRVCAYVVKLMEDHRKEREAYSAAHLAALAQLGEKLGDKLGAIDSMGIAVRELKDENARAHDRIELRIANGRGFSSVDVLVGLALAAILALAWLSTGCAHTPTQAQATAQTQSAAQEQTQATSTTQADSSARVALHRGARHLAVTVAVPLDGGAPVFGVALDEDPDDISAGAIGEADAGAASAADAGSTSTADAGAEAQTAPPQPFWSAWKLALVAVILAIVLAAVVLRKAGRL